MHYPRVHPDQWRDRIRKARLMGLNAIETYVAWNAHEPVRGEWSQTGAVDLGRFLDLIAEEGMHAIVRPGPYVCAEWHNGGLPTWLTADPSMKLRSSDPRYLAAVSDYLARVNEILVPRQIDQGGSVILVQIENEYGAYGSDKAYLAELIRLTRDAGITVPLTQVDQPIPHMLENGAHEGLHKTGSFGSRITERLATLREHQPTGPLMCMEFWCGWFDHWGEKHHTTAFADSAADLDTLLAAGASVNIYMVHGGTNFGLTAGANDSGRYLPMVTSYDYDSPISESGDITEKFRAFREVIAKHAPVPDEPLPEPLDAPVFEVALESVGDPLRPRRDRARHVRCAAVDGRTRPDIVLAEYAASLDGTAAAERPTVLEFDEVRDYAWVHVDDRPAGTLQRTLRENALTIPAGREPAPARRRDRTRQLRHQDRRAQGPDRRAADRRHADPGAVARAHVRCRRARSGGDGCRGIRRPWSPVERPARSGCARRSRSTSPPTCSSTPAGGARATRGSTGSSSGGTGAGVRSARCSCRHPSPARARTSSRSSSSRP